VAGSVDGRERPGSCRQRTVTVVTLVVGLSFLVLGAWAFFAPRSFYDNVAAYEPYNRHLLHDIGAFQAGIGAALLAALLWSDGLFVALVGGTVGAVVHDVSHIIDHGLGGRSSDPWWLGLDGGGAPAGCARVPVPEPGTGRL
jgi:hypothetical protein